MVHVRFDAARVSSWWLRNCAAEGRVLDHKAADSATFRTLPSSLGIPGLKGLRVCLRNDEDFSLASDPDLHEIIFGLECAGLEWCDKHVADCSLILASRGCLPVLIEDGSHGSRRGKHYRWADGEEWTASIGCVDKEVSMPRYSRIASVLAGGRIMVGIWGRRYLVSNTVVDAVADEVSGRVEDGDAAAGRPEAAVVRGPIAQRHLRRGASAPRRGSGVPRARILPG